MPGIIKGTDNSNDENVVRRTSRLPSSVLSEARNFMVKFDDPQNLAPSCNEGGESIVEIVDLNASGASADNEIVLHAESDSESESDISNCSDEDAEDTVDKFVEMQLAFYTESDTDEETDSETADSGDESTLKRLRLPDERADDSQDEADGKEKKRPKIEELESDSS